MWKMGNNSLCKILVEKLLPEDRPIITIWLSLIHCDLIDHPSLAILFMILKIYLSHYYISLLKKYWIFQSLVQYPYNRVYQYTHKTIFSKDLDDSTSHSYDKSFRSFWFVARRSSQNSSNWCNIMTSIRLSFILPLNLQDVWWLFQRETPSWQLQTKHLKLVSLKTTLSFVTIRAYRDDFGCG